MTLTLIQVKTIMATVLEYKVYPIRCNTCGRLIDCYAGQYEALLEQGYTIEEALDQLGYKEPMCRIPFMTPTIVKHNLQNQNVVDGTLDVTKAVAMLEEEIKALPKEKKKLKGEGIQIQKNNVNETFVYPTEVGIPTINKTSAEHMIINVGSKKTCVVLSGTTYLAE